jgi:hypothetical protein
MRFPFLIVLGVTACSGQDSSAGGSGDQPLPIDPAVVESADTVAEWPYRRNISADLTGDGQAERVMVAAEVSLTEAGFPLWEDGHRWGIFAEAPTGERTLLYSGFVPNGFVEAAVLAADSLGASSLLVQERTPNRLRTFELRYEGPGDADVVSSQDHQIGVWLPGSASLAGG